MAQDKIYNYETLAQKVADLRKENPHIKIGVAIGSYDLFHEGHRVLLEEASQNCDFLIAAVNEDANVSWKSSTRKDCLRPVIPEQQRLKSVAAIGYVAAAVLVKDKPKFLELIKPDVYFRGRDYDISTHGNEKIKEHYIDTDAYTSTSGIIKKIIDEKKEQDNYRSGINLMRDKDWYRD